MNCSAFFFQWMFSTSGCACLQDCHGEFFLCIFMLVVVHVQQDCCENEFLSTTSCICVYVQDLLWRIPICNIILHGHMYLYVLRIVADHGDCSATSWWFWVVPEFSKNLIAKIQQLIKKRSLNNCEEKLCKTSIFVCCPKILTFMHTRLFTYNLKPQSLLLLLLLLPLLPTNVPMIVVMCTNPLQPWRSLKNLSLLQQ